MFSLNTNGTDYTNLYDFMNQNDGSEPTGVILSGNMLYGTAMNAGANGQGVVFAVSTSGTNFSTLFSFSENYANANGPVNSDGSSPRTSLNLTGTTLYGTAPDGGPNGHGTVFAVTTNGTFTTISSLPDGDSPESASILSGNTFYGTTYEGGTDGDGTVFAVNTDGTGYTNLYNFTDGNDGEWPIGGLILSGGTLYGTTISGGTNNLGTLFAINTNGTGFITLYSFTLSEGGANPFVLSNNKLYVVCSGNVLSYPTLFSINTDGTGFTNIGTFSFPNGLTPINGIILSGNTIYGTTKLDGANDEGSVFSINTDGTDFEILYSFSALSAGTNSGGAYPEAGLILSGNTLYGTASEGGAFGAGTVFSINTDGTGFATLHSFSQPIYGFYFETADYGAEFYTNSDGAYPWGGLILSGNTLYGTATEGGANGYGTMFSLSLPSSSSSPELSILLAGQSVILTWPSTAIGYTLESATNLVQPVTWAAVSPAPVDINGQFTVTNVISGKQMFYQLSQ